MTGLRTLRLILGRLRQERGTVLLVFGLVAVIGFMLAAAPRLLVRTAEAGLRYEMGAARASQRNLQISTVTPPIGQLGGAMRRGIGGLEDAGQAYQDDFPAVLRRLVSERNLVVELVRFQIDGEVEELARDPDVLETTAGLQYPTYITPRYQSGLDGQIDIVQGRLPASTGTQLPAAQLGFPTGEPPERARPFEIAISADTAQTLELDVGDRLVGSADALDPIVPFGFERPLRIELRVVGIFSIREPQSEYWHDDVDLQVVNLAGVGDTITAFAHALFAPDAYAGLTASQLPQRLFWRYRIDSDRLAEADVDRLATSLRRIESRYRTTVGGRFEPGDLVLEDGLLEILGHYQTKRSTTEAVLSVAAIGPLSLAAAAMTMVAVLVVSRRRGELVLSRGRGASGGLLLMAQACEGLLIAGPGALAGLALAALLLPAPAGAASSTLAGATIAGAVALLVGATWPFARRTLGTLEREDPPLVRLDPRRLVVELTAIGLAVTGAFLLRERGVTIASEPRAGGLVRFDPFLGAVPVLIGIATGLLAVRLYPLPIRAFGWLAARRRDLVPVLGLRTVGRHPTVATLPLLVLIITAAIGAFSSVIVATVERGQLVASWQEHGADFTISAQAGDPLPRAVDPGAVPGVEAVAAAYADPEAVVDTGGPRTSRIRFLAVETAAYRRLLAGTPVRLSWPPAFESNIPGGGRGGDAGPLPAVVSRSLPAGFGSLPVGTRFGVTVRGERQALVVVETRESFPGMPADGAFIITPFEQLVEAHQRGELRPTTLFLRGDPDIADALRDTIRQQSTLVGISSRHATYAAVHDAPLSAAIASGFRVALLLAAGFTALTIVAALTLTAARRTRDLVYLRTLGITTRQTLGLVVVEHGPPLLFALVAGVGLGLGVAWMLVPGLALGSFIGPGATVALTIDWTAIAGVSVALTTLVALAIGGSTILARREDLNAALRLADE